MRKILARFTPDGLGSGRPAAGPADAAVDGPDLRLPEQRLLDVAARYGRIAIGERPPQGGQPAAAAGVRIVPPTDPSEAGAPVWIRRLGDREPSAGHDPLD